MRVLYFIVVKYTCYAGQNLKKKQYIEWQFQAQEYFRLLK